jgi:hypothetical protein
MAVCPRRIPALWRHVALRASDAKLARDKRLGAICSHRTASARVDRRQIAGTLRAAFVEEVDASRSEGRRSCTRAVLNRGLTRSPHKNRGVS